MRRVPLGVFPRRPTRSSASFSCAMPLRTCSRYSMPISVSRTVRVVRCSSSTPSSASRSAMRREMDDAGTPKAWAVREKLRVSATLSR